MPYIKIKCVSTAMIYKKMFDRYNNVKGFWDISERDKRKIMREMLNKIEERLRRGESVEFGNMGVFHVLNTERELVRDEETGEERFIFNNKNVRLRLKKAFKIKAGVFKPRKRS